MIGSVYMSNYAKCKIERKEPIPFLISEKRS